MKQLRIDFLNSKMAQAVREKVLNSFKSGKTQFLITTDVVNRGIDIPNLNYVLNYDFPTNLVTYISLPSSCCPLHTTSTASVARVATTRQFHHTQYVAAGAGPGAHPAGEQWVRGVGVRRRADGAEAAE